MTDGCRLSVIINLWFSSTPEWAERVEGWLRNIQSDSHFTRYFNFDFHMDITHVAKHLGSISVRKRQLVTATVAIQ